MQKKLTKTELLTKLFLDIIVIKNRLPEVIPTVDDLQLVTYLELYQTDTQQLYEVIKKKLKRGEQDGC